MYFIYVYMYVYLYRYVLFALVCACSYLRIFTYLFGSYWGLIRWHSYFEVPYHCIVINISLFMYGKQSTLHL